MPLLNGGRVERKRASAVAAAPQRRHLDLHLHLRLDKVADDHHRRWPDFAEHLSRHGEDALDIGSVGHVVARAHQVCHIKPGLDERGAYGRQAIARLPGGVALARPFSFASPESHSAIPAS